MTKSKTKLSESQDKEYLKDDCVYRSIEDLPIGIWKKINQTGDLSLLFKIDVQELEDYNVLIELWTELNDQYITRYGINEKYEKILGMQKKIALLKIDFHLKNKRINKTFWRIEEIRLTELLNNDEGMQFNDTIIAIEERMGREIDPNKISVVKYYDYINYINKRA